MLSRVHLAKAITGTIVALVLGLLPVGAAQAQATRTWVSGVGDDANPCSRTAPCKTFAGAISKTAAGGIINVLDPGGFGAVTITKSIVIDAGDSYASVLASATNGVIVNAGASDVVVLRGLNIEGNGTVIGLNGIRFLAGKALFVEDTVIDRFSGYGIEVSVAASAELYVSNTTIRNITGTGITIAQTAGLGSVYAAIAGSRLENNGAGVRSGDRSRVVINDSVISGNTGNGVEATGSGATTAVVTAESVVLSANGTALLAGPNGTIRISECDVIDNGVGISTSGNGVVNTWGNNRSEGNGVSGSPTLPALPFI